MIVDEDHAHVIMNPTSKPTKPKPKCLLTWGTRDLFLALLGGCMFVMQVAWMAKNHTILHHQGEQYSHLLTRRHLATPNIPQTTSPLSLRGANQTSALSLRHTTQKDMAPAGSKKTDPTATRNNNVPPKARTTGHLLHQTNTHEAGDLSLCNATMMDQIAVAFSDWKYTKHAWCILPKEPNQPASSSTYYRGGLLFHKLFKTGSSTAVGVHLQIADRVGKELSKQQQEQQLGGNKDDSAKNTTTTTRSCIAHYTHRYGLENYQSLRKQRKSFLWTVVRDPTSRSWSSFAFYKRGVGDPIQYLQATKNQQWIQLRDDLYNKKPIQASHGLLQNLGGLEEDSDLDYPNLLSNPSQMATLLQQQVFKAYNFVAVLERWHESMVVLSLLLQIPLEDTIVLPTKSSGGWTWDWQNTATADENETAGGSCFQIPHVPTSPDVQDYLQTEFTVQNYDFWLHQAANRSLDLTIERLRQEGHDMDALIQRHKDLQELASSTCHETAVFPCSNTGQWKPRAEQDCYWRDMGCGYHCVQQVLQQAGQQEQ